jgi:hypothetical protein
MPVTVNELKLSRATLVKIRDHAVNGIERLDKQIAKLGKEKTAPKK